MSKFEHHTRMAHKLSAEVAAKRRELDEVREREAELVIELEALERAEAGAIEAAAREAHTAPDPYQKAFWPAWARTTRARVACAYDGAPTMPALAYQPPHLRR